MPKLQKKSILPMCQKSRHRKWANSVGDLNTCTENSDIMSEKNVKRVIVLLVYTSTLAATNDH